MMCPQCKVDLWCGCNACKPRNVELKRTLFTWEPEDAVKCSNCGYTEHADEWEEREEAEAFEKQKKKEVKE